MTGGGGLDKSAASALPAPLIKETAAALASQNRFMVSSTLLLTSLNLYILNVHKAIWIGGEHCFFWAS
jgi:hypothetical protein